MNNNEYVLLMKQTIDDSVKEDKKIQDFLVWVYEKTSSLGTPYQESALRAFYCDAIEGIMSDYYTSTSEKASVTVNRKISRLLDSNLDKDIGEARDIGEDLRELVYASLDYNLSTYNRIKLGQLRHQAGKIPAVNIAFDKDIAIVCKRSYSYEKFKSYDGGFHRRGYLGRAIALLIQSSDRELQKELMYIMGQFPDAERGEYYYEIRLKRWREYLISCLSNYRNLKLDWQFSDEQKQLLDKYSAANQLLLDCLKASNASPEVAKEIQDSLLLPTIELERRKTRK